MHGRSDDDPSFQARTDPDGHEKDVRESPSAACDRALPPRGRTGDRPEERPGDRPGGDYRRDRAPPDRSEGPDESDGGDDNASKTSLGGGQFAALLWTTFATFATLYGIQPLLPLLARNFHVGDQAASLAMPLGILPLGLAPICYGCLLNVCPTRTLTVTCVVLCAASVIAASVQTSFPLFLTLRTLSCLLIPAIVLGIMTHIARFCVREKLQRAMTVYTTTTMLGAFGGRIGSGFAADHLGLRGVLVLHACLLLSSLPFLWRLPSSGTHRHDAFSPRHVLQVIRQPGLPSLMAIGPLCVFAHASVLNLAPFRLRGMLPDAGDLVMGLLYAPAFVCTMLGVFSKRVLRLCHGEMRTIRTGVFLFIASMALVSMENPVALFCSIFVMTSGFVLVYTTLPGVVNRVSRSPGNMTNSVYISFYYALSALGTWLPILIYGHFGVTVYVSFLVTVFLTALHLVHRHMRDRIS